ncbi:putative bifunctional diguanylate cyclase/phosphodiesterase [Sphingomonas sp.]|jgi:diguanylate cyclase (GGDEF)-like protein|uniref:putative bifunctional diguanylate cyclase/phosphodiesterase n=1 Tax=Sphingomonas sp. TaxID=28214 RepID=UPI002E330158|nr:EAL domain-containing protein [Sphingomonas sp.]HEX4693119.1 EAL domain-containing protein [Sphingomonas sp.]
MAPSSQFPKPRIDVRALLGLYDPADTTDWGPIRAAQLHAGRQLALFLLAANLIGAALMVILLDHHASRSMLIGWGVATGGVGIFVAIRRLATRHRDASSAPLRDVRDTVVEGIALAIVWAAPPLALAARIDIGTAMAVWILLSIMMTASAVAMAALPLATLSFLGILGTAIATMLIMLGSPLLAAATILFVALLMIGCYQRCKALVVIRANEIGLSERDATVSLLLREFEEEDGDWLWETDSARRIVRASPRFARSIHLDPVKINGMPLLQALAGERWESGEFSPGLRTLSEKLKGREPFRDLVLPVHVDGSQRWFALAASPRFDDRGAFMGFRGVGSDVTVQRESADQINRMARFDTLTGLPNRLQLNEQLAKAMADAEKWGMRCAFMMIDLDRFKAVNDSLGHPVGDRLLGRVSERLSRLVTENETIGRLGGDEFAVVVRDASDTERIDRLARSIIETLSRPYDLDAHTLFIGASVGVAIGPRDGRTAEMLVRSADLALYRSKDAGGGVFHAYEPQLHVKAEERRVLEMALRQALEKGEMHLEYQPVVAAGTGGLTGFEALLRWTHPELGVVSPAKFVPLAEDARLIGPMGEWVLRSACDEASKWPSPTRVAVNVSPEQLLNPAFVAVVASALANSGLPPQRLELEVTEGVFMREGTVAVQVLERILDLGVRLSLDDFGTGYSSLGYLARTRFSTIKVDRSFVQGASKGQKEPIAIIRAVVALAQSLGMATTAEGVETEQEHLMVQELGCTKVQGYYFGRPLPVAEARALAARSWDDAAAA